MGWSNDSTELTVINRCFTYLDFMLIIPGAVGSSLTGLIMCKFSSLGFLRYRWVIAKWEATIIGILVGAALLGPWQLQMLKLTSQAAGEILADTYNIVRLFFSVTGILQVILLIFIVTVSVRKPWSKSSTRQNEVRIRQTSTVNTGGT